MRYLLLLALLAQPALGSYIHTTDPFVEIAKGLSGNDYIVNKFGHNSDVDAPREAIVEGLIFKLPNADDVATPFGGATRLLTHLANISESGDLPRNSTLPIRLEAKTDITCNAQTGGNSDVSCTMHLAYYED